MRKILVGFDGSEGSEHAMNRAILLLDQFGELILLAVIPSPSDMTFVDAEMYKTVRKKAEKMISDVVIDIGKQDFIVTKIVEEGDPAARIIDIASKLNVDLIVLGSRGTSELGHYSLGSVANKVVQYAHKPVMVVR
jgi:nucleotide-binding universal stress UspA family protein